MVWLFLAFLTALSRTLQNVLVKFSLREIDEYVVALSWWLFSVPFLLLLLPFTHIPSVNLEFWIGLFGAGVTGAASTIIYAKAIKQDDLSLAVPLTALTPAFLLVAAPLIVGESVGFFGVAGVLLITLGSYTLYMDKRHAHFLAPFQAIVKSEGGRHMLAVALIWSIGASFEKIGVQNSAPIFWSVVYCVFVSLLLLPVVAYKSRTKMIDIKRHWKLLGGLGFSFALVLAFQMTALQTGPVTYVIAVKRMSILFTSLLGFFLFGERSIFKRTAGVIVMLAGVFFIAFS